MSILNRIRSAFAKTGSDPNVLWLYVRCARCGAPLAVRVDLRNELSADYERGGYVLYKEMMDNKCFTLMRAVVQFDQAHNMIGQTVDKGEVITRAEYQRMKNE